MNYSDAMLGHTGQHLTAKQTESNSTHLHLSKLSRDQSLRGARAQDIGLLASAVVPLLKRYHLGGC